MKKATISKKELEQKKQKQTVKQKKNCDIEIVTLICPMLPPDDAYCSGCRWLIINTRQQA